jgi:NAD(P)-dependent dehydrogenase (short-subunit alcohol dehydrogenase family)
MPDLTGFVVLITGGNSGVFSWPHCCFLPKRFVGLGKETAKVFIFSGLLLPDLNLFQELLKRSAKVYIAARSKEKAEEAIRELEKETGQRAHFLELDLADLQSVKAAAEDFMR